MTQYWSETFPRKSLTETTLTSFTKLGISKIKKWTDLAHVFIEQYKFDSEIVLDREQLQRISKKLSERFFVNMLRGGVNLPHTSSWPSNEKENVMIFMSSLSWMYFLYYNLLIGHASAAFVNLVQNGERIKDVSRPKNLKIIKNLFEEQSRRKDDQEEYLSFSLSADIYPQSSIYQLTGPSPPPPVFGTMYPPPPICHPQQQYRPNNQHH